VVLISDAKEATKSRFKFDGAERRAQRQGRETFAAGLEEGRSSQWWMWINDCDCGLARHGTGRSAVIGRFGMTPSWELIVDNVGIKSFFK
jgi:hypothetical protein